MRDIIGQVQQEQGAHHVRISASSREHESDEFADSGILQIICVYLFHLMQMNLKL